MSHLSILPGLRPALVLAALLLLPAPATAQLRRPPEQPSRPVTVRASLGLPEGGSLPTVVGLGLGVPLMDGVAVLGSAQRWATDTVCDDSVPSTCGRDGWAGMASLRLSLTGDWLVRPFVEGGIGVYRFGEEARDGQLTRSLGTRYGATVRDDSGVELDLAWQTLRLAEYEKEGLAYPSVRLEAIQLEVGLPLG